MAIFKDRAQFIDFVRRAQRDHPNMMLIFSVNSPEERRAVEEACFEAIQPPKNPPGWRRWLPW